MMNEQNELWNEMELVFPSDKLYFTERLNDSISNLEKEMIIRTLEHYNNNRRAAAKSLDMSERTLYRKINDYGIEKKINKDN